MSKQTTVIRLNCKLCTGSQWENDESPIFREGRRSHNVASIYMWQVSVKYINHGIVA